MIDHRSLHTTRAERSRRPREKRKEDECFGFSEDGSIFELFIGAIIIIVGLQQVFRVNIDIGPFAIIILGLLVVAGAICGCTRK